jgi:hypothetical protein
MIDVSSRTDDDVLHARHHIRDRLYLGIMGDLGIGTSDAPIC